MVDAHSNPQKAGPIRRADKGSGWGAVRFRVICPSGNSPVVTLGDKNPGGPPVKRAWEQAEGHHKMRWRP